MEGNIYYRSHKRENLNKLEIPKCEIHRRILQVKNFKTTSNLLDLDIRSSLVTGVRAISVE